MVLTDDDDEKEEWEWVVLFASYVNILVGCGLAFMAVTPQLVFLTELQRSPAFTSWITAMFSLFVHFGVCAVLIATSHLTQSFPQAAQEQLSLVSSGNTPQNVIQSDDCAQKPQCFGGPGQVSLLESLLANSHQEQQNQILKDLILSRVHFIYPEWAETLTHMLLQLNNHSELLCILESPQVLKYKVEELTLNMAKMDVRFNVSQNITPPAGGSMQQHGAQHGPMSLRNVPVPIGDQSEDHLHEGTREAEPNIFANRDHILNGRELWPALRYHTPTMKEPNRQKFFCNLLDKMQFCSSLEEFMNISQSNLPRVNEFPIVYSRQTLQTCKVPIDEMAQRLRTDEMKQKLAPILTEGDGNCMPRALSLACFGTDVFFLEMRCRMIIEMCLYPNFYLQSKVLDAKKMAMLCVGNIGLNLDDFSNITKVYEYEIKEASQPGRPLRLWHLASSASFLGIRIILVHPRRGDKVKSDLHNIELNPRTIAASGVIYLLCTRERDDMNDESWDADHIVPLLPYS